MHVQRQHRPHQQPQSLYVVNNLYGMNVTTLNDKKMRVGRSVRTGTSPSKDYCSSHYYHWPSPKRERNIEIVSRSPQHASWWTDNETKRKGRVAKYKLYAAEGKLKSSLKKRFRSFKVTCMKIVTNL